MTGGHDAYAALRIPDYRRLLFAGILASIGGEIQAVAVGWELYQRTGSAWALGFAGLAQFLPVLLLALPAGHAADHFSRKLIFQLALAGSALASTGLAALSFWQGPIELVYACLTLAGMGRAFSAPARQALLAQIVPLETLGNAVTWNSSGWQLANVSGPALGGLIVTLAGHSTVAYLAAGCSALTCIIVLAPIQPRPIIHLMVQPRSLGALLAGVGFVWRTKLLLAAITLDLFAVLLGGATALLPIFARDILQTGPAGFGWLRTAPAVGALLMAVTLTHRPPLLRPGRALLVAVAGYGGATVAFGRSENYLLSFIMLVLTGAFDNISVVVRGTLMQALTPDNMRGRVAAVNSVFISSSNELGAFESGATAALFGPVISVVGGGIGTILVVLLAGFLWPHLYRVGPLHQLGGRDLPSADPVTNPLP
jgi:MFS family permease